MKRRNVADPKQPGLLIRYHSSGRTYALSYRRPDGKNATVTLGRHGDISLADAREAVRKMRARIALGMEPIVSPAVAGLTVSDLVSRYVESRRAHLGPKTLAGMLAVPGRLAPLGDARALKRADLEDFLRGIKPVAANRLLRLVRSAFRWGIGGELVDRDPTLGLAFNPEEGHHRDLTDDEVRQVWERGDSFVRFLLLTGARRTEAALAERSEFDLDALTWTVPDSHAKNGKGRVVYLPGAAREVIGPFPATYRATPDRVVKRLRKATGVDFRFHDLRVTFATGLAKCAAPPYVVATALGHSGASIAAAGLAPAVTAIYMKTTREPEVRSAVAAWAARVEAIVAGKAPGKVAAFRRGV